MESLIAALTFSAGYNTTLVCLGAAILGAAAGAIGVFVLLRKRSLVSEVISHATLPGLAAAFIGMALLFGSGRWLPGLLFGAALSAALGLIAVEWLARRTGLKEDTAIGAVLSSFFGLGVVLLTVVQSLETGEQAGLFSFLLGGAATMLKSEAEMIALAALGVVFVIFLLRRPFTLVCFDPNYASAQGVNPRKIDLAMMAVVLVVTVIGLKVAGLVLIVALTIIPPAAARFWTNHLGQMVGLSSFLGGTAAYLGAAISSLDHDLPTGALIVLVSFAFFLVSFVFGPVRGLLANAFAWSARRRLRVQYGLEALEKGVPIYDLRIIRALSRSGFSHSQGQRR